MFLYQYNRDKKREEKSRTELKGNEVKEVIRQTKSAQRAEYREDRPMGAFEKGAVPL